MRHLISLLGALIFFVPPTIATAKAPESAKAAIAASHHTGRDMWELYADTVQDCGGSGRPAFLCSGIMIRVATPGSTWNVWDLSPDDRRSNGVSFSYIRRDSKFSDLGESGYTVFPLFGQYASPTKKHTMQVLCAFPRDAWSNWRGLSGCGASQRFPNESGMCQEQGIHTAQQWIAHYRNAPSQPWFYQCAFDERMHSNEQTAYSFQQALYAQQLMGTDFFNERNELRISIDNWPANPADLPIQSFFYRIDSRNPGLGLMNSQTSQRNYYQQTGLFVPIIRITVPTDPTQDFEFNFIATDQVVTPPRAPAK